MWKLRLLFLSLSSVLGVFTGKTGKTTMGKCGEAKMMTGTTTGWTFEPTSDQISRESAIWNSLMFFLLNLVYFVVYDKEKKSFFCCFFDKGNFIQSRKKYQVLEMSYLRRKSFCLWMFSLSNEYKIYKLTKQGVLQVLVFGNLGNPFCLRCASHMLWTTIWWRYLYIYIFTLYTHSLRVCV